MRYAFLLPLYVAVAIAIALPGGGAHPMAPYVMTALLGAAWAMFLLRKEV